MRVLVLNNHWRASGGAETVAMQTRRLLERAGHDVVTFAVGQADDGPRPHPGGTTGARAGGPLKGIWSLDAFRRLLRLLDARPIDVAHAHNVYEGLTLSVLDALERRRVPTVLTVHDYRPVCPNGVLRRPDGERCVRCAAAGPPLWPAVRHRCVRGSVRLSAAAAAEASLNRVRRRYERLAALLAPSRFLRNVLVTAGLPAERITVVPNAVPPAPPAGAPPPAARFVFSGRLTEDKGLDVLLDAAARLRGVARIAVLGTGRREQAVRARVAAERLPVDVLGHVSPARVGHELSRSTAAVLPSLWYENCPLAILEAAARGIPVVASDLGGMRELVEHRRTGLLVAAGDADALAGALLGLADDGAWSRALGARARARVVAQHGEDAYLAAITAAYRQAARA
ncbi:MAG: glycosyltransferase [Actinobacteria bacterium]|nr:glycosyltransferase [Actinomycetota bacterium]